MNITEFLLARVTEDERIAHAAADSDPSSQGYTTQGPAGLAWSDNGGMVNGETDDLWDCEGSATLCTTPEVSAHMARYDPARVLAECAAKRAIIQDFGFQVQMRTLQALAAVYADHAEYQADWIGEK